jgi:hypothetical protein
MIGSNAVVADDLAAVGGTKAVADIYLALFIRSARLLTRSRKARAALSD